MSPRTDCLLLPAADRARGWRGFICGFRAPFFRLTGLVVSSKDSLREHATTVARVRGSARRRLAGFVIARIISAKEYFRQLLSRPSVLTPVPRFLTPIA